MESTAATTPKNVTRAACDRCHVLKSRCSRSAGKNGTCDRCRRLGIECVSSAPLRTGRPKGSGLGMQMGASRGRTLEHAPISSSADARSRERQYSTPSSTSATLSRGQEEGEPGFDSRFEPRMSCAAMQYPHLTNDALSMIDSEFSGSSMDGSTFSEGRVTRQLRSSRADMLFPENTFETNVYTPMTSNSEELTIEPALYHSDHRSWQELGVAGIPYPGPTAQSTSRQPSMYLEGAQALKSPPSIYYPTSGLLSGDAGEAMYTNPTSESIRIVPDRYEGDYNRALAERMAALLDGSHHLHAFALHPSRSDPFVIVDQLLTATKTMVDLVSDMTSATNAISTTGSHHSAALNWSASATPFADTPTESLSYLKDPHFHAAGPFFMQLASAHAYLLDMYGSIIVHLKQSLQLQGDMQIGLRPCPLTATFPPSCALTVAIDDVYQSTSIQDGQSSHEPSSLVQTISETLRRLHMSLFHFMSVLEPLASPGMDASRVRDSNAAAALQKVLRDLLLQQKPVLTELRTVTHPQ